VQAYLATVSFVDDQVGRLMEALEAGGYADNTVIVFTSDNGYHLGEKDCIQKWHLWNESTRLPLLIHVSGTTAMGQDCVHPVSHIDLYPTLIELCGLPPQPHQGEEYALDGHSLVPFLNDPGTDKWRGPPVALIGIRDGQDPPHFSVCSERYCFTLCANGEEELYDHDRDPHEWTNLAGSPAHGKTKKQLREELAALLKTSKVPEDYEPNNLLQATS